MNSQELEECFALGVYPRRGLSIVRGKDARLWDDQGNEYLDCAAGVGVANVGHANPAVAKAVIVAGVVGTDAAAGWLGRRRRGRRA